jgi:chromosome segregation ATPase
MSIEAIEQINQKANETISRLQPRLSEIEQTIREAEKELATFPKQREQRAHTMDLERSKLTSLQGELNKAEAYAKVAMGTLGEKGAIKSVSKAKKAFESGQKHFNAIEAMCLKEQAEADAKEQELSAQIAYLQGEYAAIQAELHTTRIAKEQAHKELGQLTHTSITDQLRERQKRIDELKSQLVQLQVEQHDAVEEAIEKLSPWSDHRGSLRKQYPATDATSEVIEHEIAYIKSLLRNAQALPYNDQLFNLLAIPANELHYGEHLQRNPKALRSRLNELQTLLAQHQAMLQR